MPTTIRTKIEIIPGKNKDAFRPILKKIKENISPDYYSCVMVSFNKIIKKPKTLIPGTKEEDDWLLKNWGTRREPISASWINDTELLLDTDLSAPIPIFIKLATLFKDADFTIRFTDYNKIGKNSGKVTSNEGKISITLFKDYSIDAFENAFMVRPYEKMCYVKNTKNNTYEYDVSDFIACIEEKGYYKGIDGSYLVGNDDKNKPLFDSISQIKACQDLPF